MLELEQPCKKCAATGTVLAPDWAEWYEKKKSETEEFPAGPEPLGPEEYLCRGCDGTGKVLTEDGKTVEALVRCVLAEHEESHAERYRRRGELESLQERRRRTEISNLQGDLERERWAREDLERKMKRR